MSSRTRQLVAALREALGGAEPLSPVAPLPKVAPPPAQIFPTKRTRSGYADEAASHTTALAISSGRPLRPMGFTLPNCLITASTSAPVFGASGRCWNSRSIGVSTAPGQMALQRMFSFP